MASFARAAVLLATVASAFIVKDIPRVPAASMTRERLASAIAHGEMLVIEGGGAGWRAVDEWTLDWFSARFPSAPVDFRHEDAKSPAAVRVSRELQLGSHRDITRAYGKPWYAGWGNQVEADSLAYLQPFLAPTPPWFPAAYAAQGFRTEWLYFGSYRSGAALHTDPQCHPKWSVHISGVKRWRVREYWRRALHADFDADDDDAVGDDAVIEWRADVVAGDIVLFFPQFHHATDVLSKNGSLSYTNYFVSPRDSPFIRDFIRAAGRDPRLAGMYGKCYREGATLEGMAHMCGVCAQTRHGDSARPELCDRTHGVKLCSDLAAGHIIEDETPWDQFEGKGPQKERPRGTPMRMTFSESFVAVDGVT